MALRGRLALSPEPHIHARLFRLQVLLARLIAPFLKLGALTGQLGHSSAQFIPVVELVPEHSLGIAQEGLGLFENAIGLAYCLGLVNLEDNFSIEKLVNLLLQQQVSHLVVSNLLAHLRQSLSQRKKFFLTLRSLRTESLAHLVIFGEALGTALRRECEAGFCGELFAFQSTVGCDLFFD